MDCRRIVFVHDSARDFDSSDRVGRIESPTLVFGGTDDPYFPEFVLRKTAAGIPDAELALVRGAKHGAYHERKNESTLASKAFLGRPVQAST